MPFKKGVGKCYHISNLSETEGEIKVYGEITKWAWKEYGEINSLLFDEELKQLKGVDKIVLRINSPGGSVFEAQAMYNSLKQFAQDNTIRVETFIEGVAASAATFLALAGETVKMGEGCLFMIHNPSTYSSGMSNDLRKAADLLDKVKESILDIYIKKSTLSREEISQKMTDETWFSAREALEAGFIDEIENFEDVENNISSILDCQCLETYKNLQKITNSISKTKNINQGGRNDMPKTLQDLKNSHKELLDEHEREILKNAANSDYIKQIINEAIAEERTRIEKLSNVKTFNKKQEESVKNAMFKEPKNSDELIVEFYNSEAFKAKEEIEKIEEEKKEEGFENIIEKEPENQEDISNDMVDKAVAAYKNI